METQNFQLFIVIALQKQYLTQTNMVLINISNRFCVEQIIGLMKELLGQLNKDPQRITKVDRKMVNNLDYKDINIPVYEKGYKKIQQKYNICINAFCFENALTYPIHISYIYIICSYIWLINNENKSD